MEPEWLVNFPNVNLASNIGFNREATHTVGESKLANLPVFNWGRYVTLTRLKPIAQQTHSLKIFSGRCENPEYLALDIASSIDGGKPDEGVVFAEQFRLLHPENPTLGMASTAITAHGWTTQNNLVTLKASGKISATPWPKKILEDTALLDNN